MALFSHILDYKSLTGFDLRDLSRKTGSTAQGFGAPRRWTRRSLSSGPGGLGRATARGRPSPDYAVLAARQTVLTAAYAAHPERFVGQPPRPLALPSEVWINPPADGPEPRMLQLPRDTNFVPQLSQTH